GGLAGGGRRAGDVVRPADERGEEAGDGVRPDGTRGGIRRVTVVVTGGRGGPRGDTRGPFALTRRVREASRTRIHHKGTKGTKGTKKKGHQEDEERGKRSKIWFFYLLLGL